HTTPDCRLTEVVLGDASPPDRDAHFDILRPAELGISGWERLLEAHRWADLREFFKPHVLSRLIAEGADPAVYLHVAVEVHAPLEPVLRGLERFGVVIAPRLLGELPIDGHRPDRDALRRTRRIVASLVALGRWPATV